MITASDYCFSPGVWWPTSGTCAGAEEGHVQREELAIILSLARALTSAYAGAACGPRPAQPEPAGVTTATRHLAAETSPDVATDERRARPPKRPARVRPPKPKPAVSAGLPREAVRAKPPAWAAACKLPPTHAPPGVIGPSNGSGMPLTCGRQRQVEAEAEATCAEEVADRFGRSSWADHARARGLCRVSLRGRQRRRRRARLGRGQESSCGDGQG